MLDIYARSLLEATRSSRAETMDPRTKRRLGRGTEQGRTSRPSLVAPALLGCNPRGPSSTVSTRQGPAQTPDPCFFLDHTG